MKFIFANPGTFLGNGRANSHQSGERQATPDPTGGLDPYSRVPVGTRDPMGGEVWEPPRDPQDRDMPERQKRKNCKELFGKTQD